MSDLREAAEMALSFIDLLRSRKGFTRAEILLHDLTIEVLRKALAQSEQKEWVGLTTREIIKLATMYHAGKLGTVASAFHVVEAKLKEKNT